MSTNGSGADDVVTVGEVRGNINLIENFLGQLSGDDEYLEAILQNQVLQLRAQLANAGLPGGPQSEGGVFTDIEKGALPVDAIGVAAEDIRLNDTGDAVFQLDGSTFRATVRNVDDFELDAGQAVEVVGRQNSVEAAGAAGGVSGLFSNDDPDTFQYRGRLRVVPRVVDAEDSVKVSNQLYDQGTYTNVDGKLEPGQEKTFAKISVRRNEFILLKYTNATLHDTVSYNYYIDGSNDPDEDLSGSFPWATPPDFHEVVPDGYQLIDKSVELKLKETSGSTEYDGIQGTLTGFVLSV